METIWASAKGSIKKQIPGHSFRMWIEPLHIKTVEESLVVLCTPNYFSKKRVQNHYGTMLETEIRQALGRDCRVAVEVSQRQSTQEKEPPVIKRQIPLPNVNVQPHAGRMLRKAFTFDHFVVGGNNDFAYSAALSLASQKPHSKIPCFYYRNPAWVRAICPRPSGI